MDWAKWRYVLFVRRKDGVWEPIDWSSIALYNLEDLILQGEQRLNRIVPKYYCDAKYEFMTSEELCDYLDGIDHPYIED